MMVALSAASGNAQGIRVDRAVASDLEVLVSLHMRSLPPSESLASAFGAAYVRSAYRWLMAETDAVVLVARRGAGIVGYTSLANGPYTSKMLRHGLFEAMFGLLRRPAVLAHPDLRARLMSRLRRPPPSPPAAHVVFTVVAEEARGLGVATALKEASIDACRAAGWPGIVTAVHDGNDASIRMNLRAGFRELPELRTGNVRMFYLPLQDEPRPSP